MDGTEESGRFLDRIIVVLCRPEGSLNIGSVCRSMDNMGIRRLALVGKPGGGEYDSDKIKMMALHAYPVYENALRHTTLEEAVAGTVLTAGITRRTGKNRKRLSLLPEELAEKGRETSEGDIALVFGNEQHGLNARELSVCTLACHIPSHPANPSLNLSHAVQLICYEFFKASDGTAGDRVHLPLQRMDALADTVESALQASGYYDKPDRFGTRLFFRDLFARAGLTEKEAAHLEKVFQKLRSLKAEAD